MIIIARTESEEKALLVGESGLFLASWIRDLGKTSHKEKILLGIPQISSPALPGTPLEQLFLNFATTKLVLFVV